MLPIAYSVWICTYILIACIFISYKLCIYTHIYGKEGVYGKDTEGWYEDKGSMRQQTAACSCGPGITSVIQYFLCNDEVVDVSKYFRGNTWNSVLLCIWVKMWVKEPENKPKTEIWITPGQKKKKNVCFRGIDRCHVLQVILQKYHFWKLGI